MRRVALLLLVLCCSLAGSQGQRCTGKLCVDKRSHPMCTIYNVESNYCLKRYMEQLNYSGKTKVILDLVNIPEGLQARVFDNTQFSTLIFRNFAMTRLSNSAESPFQGQHNIRKLFFLQASYKLDYWDFSPLSDLKLTDLVFSGAQNFAFSRDNDLPDRFNLSGTPTIKYLEISASCVKVVKAWSLSSFVNVEKINLVGNSIETIEPNAFPANAHHLKVIDLKANCIQTVGKNMFRVPVLPSLEEVELQMNALKELEENCIPETVRRFYIDDNQLLICNKSLKWLVQKGSDIWQSPSRVPIFCYNPTRLRGCYLDRLDAKDLDSNKKPQGEGKCDAEFKLIPKSTCGKASKVLTSLGEFGEEVDLDGEEALFHTAK